MPERVEHPAAVPPSAPDETGGEAPGDATFLGIDFGTRRIGVAVGERRLGRARPLGTVANVNGTPDWTALDARVHEWRPAAFVVGWPLDEAGTDQPITAHVKGFVKRLRRRYERAVHTVDERFSSIDAGERLAVQRAGGQRRRRTNHADVDATAAALILERWFELGGKAARASGGPDDGVPAARRETSR